MSEEETAGYLAEGVNKKGHPLDRFVKRVVTNILIHYAVPWLTECLSKYSNADFHQKMMLGFDFISDWKMNHPERYEKFIKGAKKMKDSFNFDVDEITNRIVLLLGSKGWIVYDWEAGRLRQTIYQVKLEIYG